MDHIKKIMITVIVALITGVGVYIAIITENKTNIGHINKAINEIKTDNKNLHAQIKELNEILIIKNLTKKIVSLRNVPFSRFKDINSAVYEFNKTDIIPEKWVSIGLTHENFSDIAKAIKEPVGNFNYRNQSFKF